MTSSRRPALDTVESIKHFCHRYWQTASFGVIDWNVDSLETVETEYGLEDQTPLPLCFS